MQIVIDIDEEIYNDIKDGFICSEYSDELIKSVEKGTSLPKGHGRLIDKDALGEKLHRYTEAPYQYALKVFNESPIIINADRSEE